MLSELFERFVQEGVPTVVARAVLERRLPAEALDAWFERTAQRQYTRERLFSSVFGLMLEGVCGLRASVHAAYQAIAHIDHGTIRRASVVVVLEGNEVQANVKWTHLSRQPEGVDKL